MALGMALKFYISVIKRLKLKVRKLWGLISVFVGVTAEKLMGGLSSRGAEYIQNFHKGVIYLIGGNFLGEAFLLRKIFVT